LWPQGKFGTKEVAIGIANSGVLVRQMDLDWMPPADFRKALRYQVQDVLPFSVDEANLDYHLLEEPEVPGENGEPRRVARILLVAAAREVVDAFVAAARDAGLRTSTVDLLPFALLRARTPALVDGAHVTEAIVDVGSDVVSVVVHHAGVPRYVRMIPGVGGDLVTQAVQQRYDWTWEDAERTKVYVGLPGHAHLDPSQRESVGPRSDGLDHAAQQVVAVAAGQLAGEIETTLDFYRASAGEGGSPVGRVLLAGSGSLLGGFTEHLAARLEVPVERLDVAGTLKVPGRAHAAGLDTAALAVPAGLSAGAAR
jgi:type IV pilus assembly protein PilM